MWARPEGREVVVGITAIQAAMAGKLAKVTAKPAGAGYARGRVIGTLESGMYFGTVKAPVGGVLITVNDRILGTPKFLSESPYREGWFARLRPTNWSADRDLLMPIEKAKGILEKQIEEVAVQGQEKLGQHHGSALPSLNPIVSRTRDTSYARSKGTSPHRAG